MIFKLLIIMSLLLVCILTPYSYDLNGYSQDEVDVHFSTEIHTFESVGGLSSTTLFPSGQGISWAPKHKTTNRYSLYLNELFYSYIPLLKTHTNLKPIKYQSPFSLLVYQA